MKKPAIFVMGGAGKTAAAVVARLRAEGFPVRAAVRRNDGRSAALRALGAEPVVTDIFSADSLREAMIGTQRAYFCAPIHPHMLQVAAAFAVAAEWSRLESTAVMSQWLSNPKHPALMTRQTWLADKLLARVPGMAVTYLRPGFFADNYLRMTPYAAHFGIFPGLYGEAKDAPPSNEDMARMAVAVLADPARHAGRWYRPTGPKLLGADDTVAVLSKVVGRRVRPVPMPEALLTRAGRMQGASDFEIAMFLHYLRDHRQGAFERGGPTTDMEEVTGAAGEPFEAVAQRYAQRPESQRNFAASTRALMEFMTIPFRRGLTVGPALSRELREPLPAQMQQSMDNPQWRVRRAQDATESSALHATMEAA